MWWHHTPPPPFCEVSGDPGHVSRLIPDSLGGCEGLVVAGGVEREFADELALEVDDADVAVGYEELDVAAFCGLFLARCGGGGCRGAG